MFSLNKFTSRVRISVINTNFQRKRHDLVLQVGTHLLRFTFDRLTYFQIL